MIQPSKIERMRRKSHAAQPGHSLSATSLDARLDVVQRRLIDANMRRRHRFIYAQSHASKLERRNPEQELDMQEENSSAAQIVDMPHTHAHSVVAESQIPVKSAHTSQKPSKDIITDTTASEVNVSIHSQIPTTSTPSQHARTEISTTASKFFYPASPAIGETNFRCPCCCLPQLSEVASQRHKWK